MVDWIVRLVFALRRQSLFLRTEIPIIHIRKIIRIAKSLQMQIVAEGVEEEYQADYLREHGVESAQGWFFGRPMPADQFLAYVETSNGKLAAAAVK